MSTTTAPTATSTRGQGRARRIVAWIGAVIVVLALAAYLGVSAFAANVLTTPYREFAPSETPGSLNLAFQDVRFPARGDGLEIAGWYIPNPAGHKAVVVVHGKDGNRYDTLQGHALEFAKALHDRGFALLLIDLRGHGQSADAHYSFGVNERRDVEGAVDWLKDQGFQPGSIGVLGVSMGAATATLATADDLDIGALVADCGYARIAPIIEQEWSSVSGLPGFFLPSTLLIARLMLGYDLTESRPVDVIGSIGPRPVLIIHGTADELIPLGDAEQLTAAYPRAQLWKVAGADHGGAYSANPAAYVERVAAFFEQGLR